MDEGPAEFVFVVTYGRSGSTLIQALLNALPATCVRGENDGALTHLARAWAALERPEPARSLRTLGRVSGPTHPWYGAEGVDTAAWGRALAAAFTAHVLRPPPGTRRAGFKEIRWHADPATFDLTLDFARAFFPGARFVFNSRDHEAVARSGWWARQDPARVAETLARAEALQAGWAARHPGLCCQLSYDAYVADPGALRPLFDLLGERWDEGLVRAVLARRLEHLRR